MADLRQHEALVESVAKARKESSRRPDEKLPTGRLNQINGHVYAYSGSVPSSATNFVSMMEFTTGPDALKGELVFSGPILASDPTNGSDGNFKLSLNGVEIIILQMNTSTEDMQSHSVTPLIIPPFTFVKTEMNAADNSRTGYCQFVGEVI